MIALALWAGEALALNFQDCLDKEKAGASLKDQRDCYKKLAAPAASDEKPVPAAVAPVTQKPAESARPKSMLLDAWDPDMNKVLSAYRQNYFLPISVSSNPNNAPTSPNPANQVPFSYPLNNTEAKFQFSFKARLWAEDNRDWALWFGYTQLSLWQFWDASHSRPFRESNYEPEIILSKRFPEASGYSPKLLNIAIDHQSNGQSNPRSRNWNRIYVQAGFENDDFLGGRLVLQPRIWTRIFKERDPTQDDNSDITHYLGYGDVELRYVNHYELSAIARMRSLQLDFSYPFEEILQKFSPQWHSDFNFHVQYFTGYGESLIDYNQRHSTWGIGLSLPVGNQR